VIEGDSKEAINSIQGIMYGSIPVITLKEIAAYFITFNRVIIHYVPRNVNSCVDLMSKLYYDFAWVRGMPLSDGLHSFISADFDPS